jgi:hypothetical protein
LATITMPGKVRFVSLIVKQHCVTAQNVIDERLGGVTCLFAYPLVGIVFILVGIVFHGFFLHAKTNEQAFIV